MKGTDISYWSINFGRKKYDLSNKVLQHYNRQLLENDSDCVLFLDVLEHIPITEIREMFSLLKTKQFIVRIPVSKKEGENFVLPVSQNDTTHIQIHDKKWWHKLFIEFGFKKCKRIKGTSIYESDGVLSRVYFKEN